MYNAANIKLWWEVNEEMVFRVYAGLADTSDGIWHRNSGVADDMGIDISGRVGAEVQFRILNDGELLPLTYRYRKDFTSYPSFPGQEPASVVVEVTSSAGTYAFRYTDIEINSGVPLNTWSDDVVVHTGQISSTALGEICEVSRKDGVPGWLRREGERQGRCGRAQGTTDIGGLCSSGPHLHQAASNGETSGCFGDVYLKPDKLETVPRQVTTNTALFWKVGPAHQAEDD